MLPKGWKKEAVNIRGEVQAGRQRSPSFQDGEMTPYLRVANVFDGYIDTSDVLTMPFTEAEKSRYLLKEGDILLNEGQSLELVGRPAMYIGNPTNCCFQNTLVRFRANPDTSPEYALQRFRLCLYDGTFADIAAKTTSIAHLGVSRFANLKLEWPPLEEQLKIVRALTTWDKAIDTTERLLANVRKQKQALAHRLFSRKQQISWTPFDFDAVFERITSKNLEGNTNVLTISGALGLVSQRDYFNKAVASENLLTYTLLQKGEFAYNRSYSYGYPMGAIKPLTRYDAGVVSSLYLCFRFRDNVQANMDFFRHYFEAGLLNEGISSIAQEGARNHGLLNVGVKDFFKLPLCVPSLEEQCHIASIINTAEREEHLVEEQLITLRKEKKILMQQLLTGKRRVRLPTEAKALPA